MKREEAGDEQIEQKSTQLIVNPINNISFSFFFLISYFFSFCRIMQLAIRDALCSDYFIVLATPLLRKAEVITTVDRKYGSKVCGRKDLEEVIDQVWEEVIVGGVFHLDLERETLSV